MRKTRRTNPLAVALYVNAALLLAILVAIVSGGRMPSVLPEAHAAQAQQPIAGGGGGMFLMPGQLGRDQWGCYILDVDAQTLCVYQYFGGEKKLRLTAARGIQHDRKLQRFNVDGPGPEEVEKLVEMEQARRRGAEPDRERDAGAEDGGEGGQDGNE